MTFGRKIIFNLLLVALFLNGCAAFNRDAYLQSHSFDNFLTDRPQAAEIIRQHPALEQWLRAEWRQPVGDFQIIWDNQQPARSPAAENVPAHQRHLIAIHVSKKLSPLDQIVCLSFETCNARGLPRFDEMIHQAAAGKITRADYVDGFAATEYRAVLRMQECFPKLLPPPANHASGFYNSLLEAPAEFEKYKTWQIQNHNKNYLNSLEAYGRDYDKILERHKIPGIPSASLNSTNHLPAAPTR